MRTTTQRFLVIATCALALSACTMHQRPPDDGSPPTPEQVQAQREKECDRVETLVSIGRASATLALAKSKDAKLRDGVTIALHAVDVAAADYCDQVRSGLDADAETAALKGVRAALDDLATRAAVAVPAPIPEQVSDADTASIDGA